MCSPAQRGIRWRGEEGGGAQRGPPGGLRGERWQAGGGVGMQAGCTSCSNEPLHTQMGKESRHTREQVSLFYFLTSFSGCSALVRGLACWDGALLVCPSGTREFCRLRLRQAADAAPASTVSTVAPSAHVQRRDALTCVKRLKSITARAGCRSHYSAQRLPPGAHHRHVVAKAGALSGDAAHVRTCLHPLDVIGRMCRCFKQGGHLNTGV